MATLYFISKDLLAFNSSWLHVKKMRTNHQLLQCVPLERAVHLNSARLNKQRKRKKDNFRASNKKLQCTVYEDSLLHRLCVGCGLFDEQNRNAINSMYNLAAHTFHYCFSIIMNCNKITIFFFISPKDSSMICAVHWTPAQDCIQLICILYSLIIEWIRKA